MDSSRVRKIFPKGSQSFGIPIETKKEQSPNEEKRPHSQSESNSEKKIKLDTSEESSGFPRRGKLTGHRPVTSCTFCRQHKIKCNASENYPKPCHRCNRMGLHCQIDPRFRPKKGSQIQTLKGEIDDLKSKIEMLTKSDSLITQAVQQYGEKSGTLPSPYAVSLDESAPYAYNSLPMDDPMSSYRDFSHMATSNLRQGSSHNDSLQSFGTPFSNFMYGDAAESGLEHIDGGFNEHAAEPTSTSLTFSNLMPSTTTQEDSSKTENKTEHGRINSTEYTPIHEFTIGNVTLPLSKATELHKKFKGKFLPFLPFMGVDSPTELYHRSELLFWTVMLTASLSEPEPALYMTLSSLIKKLAIETCWMNTPRSTYIIQALLILSIWPLPNEKVLDDCSFRFVGLAKNLALQLGLHRGGEFIQEFSRTQASLGPDAERWRTRTWLTVFFCEQLWSSILGLPPLINSIDFLVKRASNDASLPKNFRSLLSLAVFLCTLIKSMGASVSRADGLLDPLVRASTLALAHNELENLKDGLNFENQPAVEIYYLYVKLMMCCFAFFPGTPIEDQVKYVSMAYLCSTRIVTITSKMISDANFTLIELPIYIRQALSYAVFMLFKLHLSCYLMEKYVDSARQLIVTVHRLFRNTLSSWKDLQNDISRTAKVLENLNMVLYIYPDIFLDDTETSTSIIKRIRSHLTASLFYDLVWCLHEARRRNASGRGGSSRKDIHNSDSASNKYINKGRLVPLPFYNQITKDDFKTVSTTTPNGTTVTTLVPTDHALTQAKLSADASGREKPLEINGIPLPMLETTGSMKDLNNLNLSFSENNILEFAFWSPNSDPCKNTLALSKLPLGDSMGSLDHTNLLPMSQSEAETPSIQSEAHLRQATRLAPTYMLSDFADQFDNYFQEQSDDWLNEDHQDDFLGWFDSTINES